jgi:twitching motility protein PilT
MAVRQIPYRIIALERSSGGGGVQGVHEPPEGLVLVSRPGPQRLDTTLAAMLDRINSTRQCHIVTIEDPIEYLPPSTRRRSSTSARWGGHEFVPDRAQVHLRQDPDIILIGEMRDLETIEAAITIAETGHLVFATLHTNSAMEAVNRIVDVFPADSAPDPHPSSRSRSKA